MWAIAVENGRKNLGRDPRRIRDGFVWAATPEGRTRDETRAESRVAVRACGDIPARTGATCGGTVDGDDATKAVRVSPGRRLDDRGQDRGKRQHPCGGPVQGQCQRQG